MMTKYLKAIMVLILLILFMPPKAEGVPNDEINGMIEKAEQKVEDMKEEEALEIFKDVLKEDPENYKALWNTSLLTTRKYYRVDDEDEQLEGFKEALEIAEKTLDLYPDKGHSHYVYAVAKGRYADLEGTRDMIEASHDIGEHVEKATDLIPDYAPVWHLYGVWHSDIANVNSAERAAARLVSEGLPDEAEEDKAEKYLKKAIDMMPESILFRVDLAKHYRDIGEDEKAIEVLEEASTMEVKMMDDNDKKEEAKELLEEMT
jgi:tetratricopeptide (TPR) repeat protein